MYQAFILIVAFVVITFLNRVCQSQFVEMKSFEFDIKEQGYDVIYLKREDSGILFRVNVKTEDEFESYKSALCGKLNLCFNVRTTFPNVQRFSFHKVYCCLFGDSRSRGVKKTYTS